MLDSATLIAIDKIGHSRIPVFKGSDRTLITGFLFVKKLITCVPDSPLSESSAVRTPLYVDSSQSLFDVLDMFQSGKAHIAIVSHNSSKLLNVFYAADRTPSGDCAPCGILTIEDIFEAILQEQIFDEEDITTKNSVGHLAMNSVLFALSKRNQKSSNSIHTQKTTALEDITDPGAKRNMAMFKRSVTSDPRSSALSGNPISGNDFKSTGKQPLLTGAPSYSPLGGGGVVDDQLQDDDRINMNSNL